MEFRSTLEKELEQHHERLKQAEAEGYKEPPEIKEVFFLIKDSLAFMKTRMRTITVARSIQPSITDTDLKIASDMQLASASELVLNLLKEDLIKIVK